MGKFLREKLKGPQYQRLNRLSDYYEHWSSLQKTVVGVSFMI